MRKLIVSEWMSLDGVVQAPTSPDEDRDGGFEHGGWHGPYMSDPAFQRWVEDGIGGAGGYLLGRRTYQSFAAYWQSAPPEEQVIAAPLNARPKYVVSRTLTEPLPWQHTTLLRGDIAAAVGALKQEAGGDLLVLGSAELVPLLFAHGLVDELRLMIDPVLVGGGKRIFHDAGALTTLRLVSCQALATGAILATYAPIRR